MMTAGRRAALLGRVDGDVGTDKSLMLREERTIRGQQSFTIRFRRDKLTVIFSRIRSSKVQLGQGMWARPRLGMHPGRPSWLWTCSLRFQETDFPDHPRVTHAPSDFRHKRALYARRPFRHSAAAVTSVLPNLRLRSQFGPLRMGLHCGKKGEGLLTAGPVANMNMTRLNSGSGLYEHTRSPTRADLTPHMQAEAYGVETSTAQRWFAQP